MQQFSYGELCEVIENIRTFVVHGGQNYTFAMNIEYDSWNRIKSMTYPDGEASTVRILCWDEQNRLMSVRDASNLSDYIYNAGGERVWKITGRAEQMSINGGQVIDVVNLNNKTLYISPYMVITDQEYTKHYYAGTQRIASKTCAEYSRSIGAGFGGALVDIDVNVATLNSDVESIANGLINLLEESNTCAQIESGNVTMPEPNLPAIEELRNISIDNFESDMYFYHSDHLGSSSWITDASGDVNQHIQYLAFGEDFIYQRNSSWNIPYTFSGKEKDAETGYSYFGARYYDSDLSVWLSVDAMSDKHPNFTPYAYVYQNPINLVDPWGEDTILFNKYGEFGKPIKGNDGDKDVYIKVRKNEFKDNKIKYKNGKLRNRHKNMEIDRSFRESGNNEGSRDTYKIDGYNEGKKIFEFFSDNTKVEWAQMIYKNPSNGDVRSEISTDHERDGVTFLYPYDLKKGDYLLMDVRHNHPEGFVSPADRLMNNNVNRTGRMIRTYVYKLGKYYQYNDTRSSDELFPVDNPQSY